MLTVRKQANKWQSDRVEANESALAGCLLARRVSIMKRWLPSRYSAVRPLRPIFLPSLPGGAASGPDASNPDVHSYSCPCTFCKSMCGGHYRQSCMEPEPSSNGHLFASSKNPQWQAGCGFFPGHSASRGSEMGGAPSRSHLNATHSYSPCHLRLILLLLSSVPFAIQCCCCV